jgi:hypothetical protein
MRITKPIYIYILMLLSISQYSIMALPTCDAKAEAQKALAILTCIGAGSMGLNGFVTFTRGVTGFVPENSTRTKHVASGIVQMGIASGYLVAASYSLMDCEQ